MVYTSLKIMSRESKKRELIRKCIKGVNKWGNKFKIGLGCVGRGMMKVEPQLSEEELLEDIKIAAECGVEECVIFRLAGVLKKECWKLLGKFLYNHGYF